MKTSELIHNKRLCVDHSTSSSQKRRRSPRVHTAVIYIQTLGLPLISTHTGNPSKSIHLEANRTHMIGRTRHLCDSVFDDSRVSKTHCQILFDPVNHKLLLSDGMFWVGANECSRARVRVSLNGVFVNGVKIGDKGFVELEEGDEVALVCGNAGSCNLSFRIGFVVWKIVFVEEDMGRNVDSLGTNCLATGYHNDSKLGCKYEKLNFLLGKCRQILDSNDPVFCIRKCMSLRSGSNCKLGDVKLLFEDAWKAKDGNFKENKIELSHMKKLVDSKAEIDAFKASKVESSSILCHRKKRVTSQAENDDFCVEVGNDNSLESKFEGSLGNNVTVEGIKTLDTGSVVDKNSFKVHTSLNNVNGCESIPSPGNKFYLNRLQSMDVNSSYHHDRVVSLPELLYPIESIQKIFIATFTCDIQWFLSSCNIPNHIPVTIACHNRDRCWSSRPEERISMPYPGFSHIVMVYPPFPEAIAFGNDRKKLGIACHHPKLFVLLREDSIRVVITSANLVPKQWNNVTNTVWWQDFPRASKPDYLSLFTHIAGDINQKSQSDFAAQLAGFMASLVADVPNQAHWILELTKYNFEGAVGHLIASVPGIHYRRSAPTFKSMYFSFRSKQFSPGSDIIKTLGSIETFLVGLSHLFHSSSDSNGTQLKKLASFIQNSHTNSNGMLQVVLKRNKYNPADVNAVSINVPNPHMFLVEGFLPRHVAKWVAPLLDSGLFMFSGYIYPKQVLPTALEGSSSKVHMLLHVSQGPSFSSISTAEHVEHHPAICALVASIQRSTGIWRLHEVLSRYQWPENLETDFVFGSSSIGAVNAQFLAAFSAAAGKTSMQMADSEESDPDWGCWSASQELISPSMRIIFPTIGRVKSASCGILASRNLLCFSQKTWYRLRNVGILHDAIPYPYERVNIPMHVKVARRRFQSKTDDSSFGWVYCGSHNLSAAAWGLPLSNSIRIMGDKAPKSNSILGSRLRICNYELGIVFIVPPSDKKKMNLDDIVMPFVVPAPKYRASDRPATPQAMREAYAEVRWQEKETVTDVREECAEEEILDEEEEILEATNYVAEEQFEEKAYAEALWSQVDSSQSC